MAIIQHILDLVLFLIIVAGCLPLCLFAYLLHLNRSPSKSYLFTRLFLFILISWSIIETSIGISLGLLNQLNLRAIIVSEFVVFLLGLLLIHRQLSFRACLIWKAVRFNLSKLELVTLGSIALMGFFLLETLAIQPITDFDSLWFHLPAIARWYQTGSLTLSDPVGNLIFEHPDAKAYPYNWHILSVLFVIPFREDFLVALPMLISWAMLGLAIYLSGVELGATRLHSMAGAALVLSMPMLLNQVNTIHIDLPLASFFAVGLYLVISYHKTRSPIELMLFLASLGMLAGIKTPGIIYSAFLGGGLLGLEIRKTLQDKRPLLSAIQSACHPFVATGLLLCLFLGGFWYIRNFSELHHQVADSLATRVASLGSYALPQTPNFNEIGEKIYKLQRTTLTHQFNPADSSHWQLLGMQLLSRLQLPFLALMMPAILLPIALINRQNKVKKTRLVYLSALLLLTGFLYWNTPYSSGTNGYEAGQLNPLLGYNIRYGFPFFGVLGVAAAVSATALNTPGMLVGAIVCLSSIFGVLSNSIFDIVRRQNFTGEASFWATSLLNQIHSSNKIREWLITILTTHLGDYLVFLGTALGLILLAFVVLSNSAIRSAMQRATSGALSKNSRGIVSLVCVGLLTVGLFTTVTWMARAEREIQRTEVYRDIYSYVENNVKQDEKIAYFSSYRNYLFYGDHLDKSVLHIPSDLDSPEQWLDYFKQHQVSLVATGPGPSSDAKEVLAELVHRQRLEPIFGSDIKNQPVLYRLKLPV